MVNKYKVLIFFTLILCLYSCLLNAQTDTINMKAVEVSSQRIPQVNPENSRIVLIITDEEIKNAPVQSLNELLGYISCADVRQRGQEGVQADISMRGGSFEQTLILLNGVKINDPQTGHHSMDIPVNLEDIERIEILEGPGIRTFGINAYSGAINIITKNEKGKSIALSAMAGGHGLYSLSGKLSLDFYGIQNTLSAGKKSSDGYIPNTDFDIMNLYYRGSKKSKFLTYDIQAGYTDKNFGANSFYSAKYPDQYEETRTLFTSAGLSGGNKIKFSIQAFYRRHQDRFELFRNNPPLWYKGHNYHLTHVCGTNAGISFLSKLGKTSIGGEFRNEQIYSNVLGDPLNEILNAPGESSGYYDKGKNRKNFSFYGEQTYYYRRVSLSAGLMLNKTSGLNWKVYGGGDMSLAISPEIRLIASVNQSVRLPSFTEIYYQGPQNKGNPFLKPEEAVTYEVGLKINRRIFTGHAVYFIRNSKNLIDWVRMPDSVKWESQNITQLITHGLEASTAMNFREWGKSKFPIESLNLSYALLFLQKKSETYISYYVLDYLKHKLILCVSNRLYKNLKMNWSVSFYSRAGTYTDFKTGSETKYKPFCLLDCSLFYDEKPVYLFIECSNLTGVKYIDIGNIEQPGRWIKAGLNINLSIKPLGK